jgi:hypothetical protein
MKQPNFIAVLMSAPYNAPSLFVYKVDVYKIKTFPVFFFRIIESKITLRICKKKTIWQQLKLIIYNLLFCRSIF